MTKDAAISGGYDSAADLYCHVANGSHAYAGNIATQLVSSPQKCEALAQAFSKATDGVTVGITAKKDGTPVASVKCIVGACKAIK